MTNLKAVLVTVVMAVGSVACGAVVEPGDGAVEQAATRGDLDAPGSSAPGRAELCAAPRGGRRATLTREDFVGALLGAWILCSDRSVFGTTEAGLEFTDDGRFYKLVATDTGYARASGWDDAGTWTAQDASAFNGPGAFQLNLDLDGGGGIGTFPAFSTSQPDAMRLNNMGVFVGDYVRAPR